MTLGERTEEVFREVLSAAEDDLSAQAAVLTNMGNGYAGEGQPERAQQAYRQAIELGTESGAPSPAVLAWNGLGVMWHAARPQQAQDAYRQGLLLCERTGDAQLTAMLLANLAELEHDLPAWEQAIALLERGGFSVMAGEFRADLDAFRAETIMGR